MGDSALFQCKASEKRVMWISPSLNSHISPKLRHTWSLLDSAVLMFKYGELSETPSGCVSIKWLNEK